MEACLREWPVSGDPASRCHRCQARQRPRGNLAISHVNLIMNGKRYSCSFNQFSRNFCCWPYITMIIVARPPSSDCSRRCASLTHVPSIIRPRRKRDLRRLQHPAPGPAHRCQETGRVKMLAFQTHHVSISPAKGRRRFATFTLLPDVGGRQK